MFLHWSAGYHCTVNARLEVKAHREKNKKTQSTHSNSTPQQNSGNKTGPQEKKTHRGLHGVAVGIEELVGHRPPQHPEQLLRVPGHPVREQEVFSEGGVHAPPGVEGVVAHHLQPSVDALVFEGPRDNVRQIALLLGGGGKLGLRTV